MRTVHVSTLLLLLLLLLLSPSSPSSRAAAAADHTADHTADHHLRAFIESELRADPALAVLVAAEERHQQVRRQQQVPAEPDEVYKPAAPSERSLLQIAQAKSRLASRVAAYLAASAEPYNGLSEPSNNCRTLLNTWMATCVFG